MAGMEPGHVGFSGNVWITRDELRFSFSRSGGPGGQNVNKVNTRVSVAFDVLSSRSLTPDQKERLKQTIAHRLGRDGVIRVSCQRFRTQAANRRAVVRRLLEMLGDALRPPAIRKATRPPHAAERRRLEAKRRLSRRKTERRWRSTA